MEFSMHQEQPSVYRLPVHLEGMYMVYFNDHDNPEEVLNHPFSQGTHLTVWLKASELYPDARNYTYQEFPEHFVFKQQEKKWTPRQCGFSIG
jgi:hypothetical protein